MTSAATPARHPQLQGRYLIGPDRGHQQAPPEPGRIQPDLRGGRSGEQEGQEEKPGTWAHAGTFGAGAQVRGCPFVGARRNLLV